jgi:gentisate 1,2-dioxygenase
MEPEDGFGQTLHIHLEEYAPGGKSQMHGHVNEAVFYILDGRGYEIHDGIRYDWKAGDIAIVHNNCVHQHNNADEHKPARALVIKTKPMYMFMNMLFQKRVTERPKEPTPTQGDFKPREDVEFNQPWHDHDHDHAHPHAHSHGE